MTKKNKTKQFLKEGKTVVGTMVTQFDSPEITRMLAKAGFDFAFIDTEHSPFSLETVTNMVRVGKMAGLTCLARVPDAQYHLIARTLDAGAQGLMIPRVETKETAEAIVRAAKYPPLGERGFAARPMLTDYESISVRDLAVEQNEDTLVVLQIERKRAIDNIESMVAVPGIDVALIGPNDLSISLGVPGEEDSPVMIDAIQKTVDACKKHNVASGIHLQDMKRLLFWQERGMTMLTYGTDMKFLLSAATASVGEIRKHL